MQSQFIAKYKKSHLVTRKNKTSHNSSQKITVLAIFSSRTKVLELYTESVFFGWYRLVFLGNYHTDTKGKLGRYFQYRRYKKVRIYSK
jgi:hypothetical protein